MKQLEELDRKIALVQVYATKIGAHMATVELAQLREDLQKKITGHRANLRRK